ncbi:MAG TPA: hypothetical protein VJT73_18815 [Polyangiaceae bacterium]|nr:hypothetical protein [Polyangiaceae bacterium]
MRAARVGSSLVLLASMLAVAYARPKLVAEMRTVKVVSDVFALPPPAVLTALSLGYRSALADLLYASTLVSYGIHGEERRRFEFVGQYLDSIVALDPHICQLYRYADLFLIYQAKGSPTPDDVRHARRLLDRGLEECKTDGHLWLSAGQFMVFIGTQFLTDEAEKAEYRREGARVLARAADLVSTNQNVQWQALAAAGVFTKEGNREAAISFYERLYTLTDEESLRAKVVEHLAALRREGAVDEAKRRRDAFQQLWRADLPFVSATGLLVLGPPSSAAACAGVTTPSPRCPQDWSGWNGSGDAQ